MRLRPKSLILSLRSGRAEPFRTAGGRAAIFSHLLGLSVHQAGRCLIEDQGVGVRLRKAAVLPHSGRQSRFARTGIFTQSLKAPPSRSTSRHFFSSLLDLSFYPFGNASPPWGEYLARMSSSDFAAGGGAARPSIRICLGS